MNLQEIQERNYLISRAQYANGQSDRLTQAKSNAAAVTVGYDRDPNTGQLLSSNGSGYLRTSSITTTNAIGRSAISLDGGARTGFTDLKPFQ